MTKLLVKNAALRRIVLSNGGQVAVGPIECDQDDSALAPFTGIRFDRAGEETVRFGISAEAREALVALLTNSEAGEAWDMPSDYRSMMTLEWRLVRDEDLSETSPQPGSPESDATNPNTDTALRPPKPQ